MTVHAGQHASALRPLQHAEREELRQSIEAHGVQVPIIVDQNGTIIDGHHRWAIAAEMGLHCPVLVHDVDDDEEAAEIARTVNVARRHIDPATWATLVADHRQRVASLRAEGRSLQQIADEVGVSRTQVRKDITTTEVCTGAHLAPTTVTGADGKTYPAARPTPAPVVDDEPWDDEPFAPDSAGTDAPGVESVGAGASTSASTGCRREPEDPATPDPAAEIIAGIMQPTAEEQLKQRLNRWMGQVNDGCRLMDPAQVAAVLAFDDAWWDGLDRLDAQASTWFAAVRAARPTRHLRSVGGTR